MKNIRIFLLLGTIILLSPACSAIGNSVPPTAAPSIDTVATSAVLTFEAKDRALATNSVATFVANDSVLATSAAATFDANDSTISTSVASTLEANEITATSLASTLEANKETTPEITVTPTSTPTIATTILVSPTVSLTPTITPSSKPITVSVSIGTNCRTGPGKVYDRIGELKVGEKAEVVGKKTSYNYWVIKNPDAAGNCWLWGKYATVTGDTSKLKEYSVLPTPTPTGQISAAPIIRVSVGTNCRTGPGKIYDYIGELREGESAEVVGKNTLNDYWIIKNPDASGNCWLWGYYATIVGDTSGVPEIAVPPTPTGTTPSLPMVSVSVGTNCRTGPGKIYDYIGELKVGENAEVVGKNTSNNYWVIKNPDASGNCWLWGMHATVTGDTSDLLEYAVPPTPTPSATTSLAPIVSVNVGTNCRSGPGKVYDLIGELRVGENAEVIGKYTPNNYWIIKNPDAAGSCWLWGYYATVEGDTSELPEVAVPTAP